MAMEVINGFVCNNCTDVENAKKLIDPARPEAGPVNQQLPSEGLQRGPAVVLSGGLAGEAGSQADRDRALFRPYGPDARA